MTIERITKEQFVASERHGGSRNVPEWDAVRALEPETGVRFPCRWNHKVSCYGLSNLGKYRRITGFTLRGTCRDGYVSVWREA